MASSLRSAGTVTNEPLGSGADWVNPSNATASDDTYATNARPTGNTESDWLKAVNFGFDIPAGATIDGIVVEVECKRTGDVTWSDDTWGSGGVRIVKGGVISTTDMSDGSVWPTTDSYKTFGSATELWGETWTADDINDTNFGFIFSVLSDNGPSTGTASVDHIRITVYYTDPLAQLSNIQSISNITSITI